LLLVENKIDTTNTAMITGTTTNGEEMCIVQTPCWFQGSKSEIKEIKEQRSEIKKTETNGQPNEGSGPR